MPLILSLVAPGSPCRLLRPSARLARQWPSALSTAKHVRLRHTPHLILSACSPALQHQVRRPVALQTRSDLPSTAHDGISRFSTKPSAKLDDDERTTDEGGDIFGFPEKEEGAQKEEEGKVAEPEDRPGNRTRTLSLAGEAATDEPDISGFLSAEEAEAPSLEDVLPPEERLISDTPRASKRAPFKAQKSHRRKKAYRQSQPTAVLDSIQTPARDLYSSAPPGRTDLSYASPRRITPGGHIRQRLRLPLSKMAPTLTASVSLYSILSRYLRHLTTADTAETPFICTQQEHELLQREGLTQKVVQTWAVSLIDNNSNTAARVFQRGLEVPPLFLVLLFLRREHIRVYALGVLLNHVSVRLQSETMSWKSLKILVIRVLRHARKVWPEAIPWITTIFLNTAAKIHNIDGDQPLSPNTISEITHFCNNLLSLLSVPSSLRPMLAARHQEIAQFRVLQFMAGADPSIAVTRTGFRAVARIQLTHAKTEQEKDWAELKGPSWPPWRESRTAMDDDKAYEYGASRASKILHRMFEAGYAARGWEEVAEVYAGWDTDLSPTIQTRELLSFKFRGNHNHHLWAARIRTTRTRREAWACFLAHESSDAPAHEEIYLAMFEKLYYAELQRRSEDELHHDEVLEEPPEHVAATLLPGDMKEVLSEPSSPLHNVYLSEAVPTYEELYTRMTSKNMRPTKRLLAFLLETYPDFATTFKLLQKAAGDFDGGVGCLLAGKHGEGNTVHKVPDYFLAAFVRFLCRFGHPTRSLSARTTFLAPDQHIRQFMFNDNYLLEYAYALLLHYKPRYQPAWTAFIERVVFSRFGAKSLYNEKDSAMGITDTQYNIVVKLLDALASVDVDVEGDMFNLACTATRYAAQAVHRGNFSIEHGRDFLNTRSYRLRTLFHYLVGAHADPEVPAHTTSIPPHIPGPAELHAYVRALGVLRDYEGLYSFSTWLTKHNKEVIARARAQHGGDELLFRTLVALRAATGGWLEEGLDSRPAAPEEIRQLIKTQIGSVEEWGGWPSNKYVALYIEGHVRSATPEVGGR